MTDETIPAAGAPAGTPPPPGAPPGDPAAAPLDPAAERKAARRRKWARRRRRAREVAIRALKALVVIALFVFVIFFDRIVHSIYPGQVGVHWSRFFGGTQLDETYGEGIKLIWPWDELYIYDIREQALLDQTLIYARDGLEITVRVSVRFRPVPVQVPVLHQMVGPDYIEKVVRPETISTLRRVLGNYTPEMIYAKDEQGLLDELSRTLRSELDPETYEVTEFLVLELRLPPTIEEAIKDKLAEEQKMLSYRFRLEKEKDEKERRIIEAEGLKAFETISGVPILKWRGIEATEAIASAPSSKVVLMGTGQDLPIILNADAPTAPSMPSPAAPSMPSPMPSTTPAPVPALPAPAAPRPAATEAAPPVNPQPVNPPPVNPPPANPPPANPQPAPALPAARPARDEER
ncbi:MAG: prohibitin family protein [Myxococcales bacterium]|nr:prohibitin family protein [Myxococcales bacterium]